LRPLENSLSSKANGLNYFNALIIVLGEGIKMLNINEFLENALYKKVERDDVYWEYFDKSFDEIIKNEELKNQLIQQFIYESSNFNKDNMGNYRILLNELIVERGVLAEELYPTILKFTYHDFCLNPSIPHKFVKIMLRLKDKSKVFEDIIKNTDEDNLVKTGISIFSLYGLQSSFEDFPIELVNEFLERVYKCLQKNKDDLRINSIIENYLMEKIKRDTFYSDYLKFQNILKN
jgi:hypothetical protein